ncbi:hypothetical protein PTTG_25135 [Puccinia triticina 1-1 BBBD Race 1]|uniref:Chromo domain-containing protein n=1 Tax=Puccinia triticina (isolate 1-1 / race 1 (BBBD)) TaxID=630390 RepID=A0A180H4W7_PUCT1|nr:hypothetical protein PTTG_25135 [Puccinia triticina 1-1 BBBD Race 1]
MECLDLARKKQAKYYNLKKKPAPVYKEGEMVLLLRKFIKTRHLNSKLDYRYIGPFQVVKMIGSNAVQLDISKEYPKLHPVFNVSLIVRYIGPNAYVDRGLIEGIKEKYYADKDVVDWTLLKSILDARLVRKGKYEYLLLWNNSTVGNDTWVAEEHLPEKLNLCIKKFQEVHGELFGLAKQKRNKKTATASEGL